MDAYLAVAAFLLYLAIPVLAFVTVFSWVIAHRLWPLRLPSIIAFSNTVIGAAASWLAFVEVYRDFLGDPPEWFPVATATSVVVMCFVPALGTAYLVILEARARRER